MFVVAITALCTPLEDEAQALAGDLGLTVYETRMVLNAGLPATVLSTPDRDRAARLMGNIEGRGHGGMVVDSDVIVSSRDMISLRRFRFEPNALMTDDQPDRILPYQDVSVILRASHRILSETQSETTTSKFSAGRAIASGGMLLTSKVKSTTSSTLEDREQVLYLFRRDGEVPWILREMSTNYAGLGKSISHSRAQNFGHTMRMIRAQMPMAAFDERLVTVKRVTQKVAMRGTTESGKTTTSSSEAGVDLLAHILAAWFARSSGTAYRT